MSSFYEIVELTNGDVALQRADSEINEPLLTIRFSQESLAFLGEEKFMVAKAMIEAGMDAAGEIADQQEEARLDDVYEELSDLEKTLLH